MDIRLKIILILDMLFRRLCALVLITAAVFTGAAAYDSYSLSAAGISPVEYHGFDELIKTNPDTAAWIRIDGTDINHPVVKGNDNFEYLDKDFYGNDYAGGSIFLDEKNEKDLSDKYIIIHGHNMSGGAMFGDLGRFMNKEFFEEHQYGKLLTENSVYSLEIEGVFEADAYDSSVYYTKPDYLPDDLADRCLLRRNVEFREDDKLIALSTCSGEMNNSRIVVLARARYTGENDVRYEPNK